MKSRTGTRAAAAVVAILALTATAACSTKDDDKEPSTPPGSAGAPNGQLKTGQGVSATEIKVGELTDLSGPFAPLGKSVTQAQALYYEQLNAAGGVCNRKVVPEVKDHGYDPQKGQAAYTELSGKVVGISQLVGSAIVTQLTDSLEKEGILTLPNAWASNLLGKKVVQVTATTYDIEMINGVSYLVKTAGLQPGDKVGHIYGDDEFGVNSSAGVKFAAQQANLSIVDQKIKPTDTDMTAPVTALRSQGVKAIIVSASPRQVGPVMVVTEASNFKVPVLAHSVGFHPQLLGVAAAPMEARLHITSPAPAMSDENATLQKLVADYKAKYPSDTIDQGVLSGFSHAAIFTAALKGACTANDLTPAGIVAAHRKNTQLDVGYGAKLDFSSSDKPPSYQTYILRVDKTRPGGLKTSEQPFEAPGAKQYQIPKSG